MPLTQESTPQLCEEDALIRNHWPLEKSDVGGGVKDDALTYAQRLAQLSPYLAEFAGCVLQALAWNCSELGRGSSKVGEWKPLVVGLTLMLSTYSFACVSGAHLNPAVSIAVGLSNKGSWNKLAKYMACQFLGSAAGVGLACATYRQTLPSALGPRNNMKLGHCETVEFIYTAMICLVYLNVSISRSNNSVKEGNQFYGVAIGFAMAAGCWACEDVSGAIFNPGVALAADFQNIKGGVGYGFSYIFAEVMGAFLAAVAYRVMRPSEEVANHDDWLQSHVDRSEGITNAKLAAEGAGTWLVVFTFGMTTLSKTYKAERPFAAAAALMAMHYSLADVSGGYFNPAVTLSVMLNGRQKCSVKQGLPFMATQIFCAAFAAFVYTAIRSPSTFPVMPVESIEKYGRLHMAVVDAIFAFFVCYVALATITVVGVKANLKRNYYDGLAFGLASAAGGFSLIRLQNSLANPALTLGLSLSYVVAGGQISIDGLSTAIFQFGGAVLASAVFRFTHAADFRRMREASNLLCESSSLMDNRLPPKREIGC